MSYRCQITGRVRSNEPLNKITVATRPQVYFKMIKNEETRVWEKKQVATGTEIVREISVSLEGKRMWESWTELERQAFLTKLDDR